jgi:hypothetical protein
MRPLSKMERFLFCTLAGMIVIGLSGCGSSGPAVHTVSGTLTYQGSPLPNMGVTFQPVDNSRPSYGETDAEGHFTLRYTGTEDGALEGEHIVFVDYLPKGEEEMAYHEGRMKLPSPFKEVMGKYGARNLSPYRFTVDADVENAEIRLD